MTLLKNEDVTQIPDLCVAVQQCAQNALQALPQAPVHLQDTCMMTPGKTGDQTNFHQWIRECINHALTKDPIVCFCRALELLCSTSLAIQAARFLTFSSSSFLRALSRPSTSRLDLLTNLANRFACATFQRLSLQNA